MRKIIYSGLLIGIGFASFITVPPSAFLYDTGHPEYEKYFDIISETKQGDTIDFSAFMNGEWKTLCVFGGYTNASIHMSDIGRVSLYEYVKRRMKWYSVFRFAEVEEFESAIAYVDKSDTVQFMHMGTSPQVTFDFSFEHLTACVDSDQPTIKFGI